MRTHATTPALPRGPVYMERHVRQIIAGAQHELCCRRPAVRQRRPQLLKYRARRGRTRRDERGPSDGLDVVLAIAIGRGDAFPRQLQPALLGGTVAVRAPEDHGDPCRRTTA